MVWIFAIGFGLVFCFALSESRLFLINPLLPEDIRGVLVHVCIAIFPIRVCYADLMAIGIIIAEVSSHGF
jgi:hypothetical protein